MLAALLGAGALLAASTPSAGAAVPCAATSMPGGDWPVYGHDPANTRSQPAERALGPAAVSRLAPAWTFSTGQFADAGAFDSTPIVSGGCVLAGSTGGVAYALDAATGRVVWHRKLDVTTAGFGGALVGAPAIAGDAVIFLVSEQDAPYAIALARSTGAVVWRSAPIVRTTGAYTNASAVVANGVLIFGYSAAEGDPHGVGGIAFLDAATGRILKVTPTIPSRDQAKGYAGGGIWSTPAWDPATGYAYVGAGNPSSKQMQHPNTDAILKFDVDRSRATFGRIVAGYQGDVDQYSAGLEQASHTPVCAASDNDAVPYPLDDPACGQLDLDFGAAPDLFPGANGRTLVGDLQKSGVYHVADAGSMKPAWTAPVGLSCAACNAASTAFDGASVLGVSTPGGVMNAIAREDGAVRWRAPVGDGAHYQSTSVADGVAYTLDGNGFLDAFDAFDAASGDLLLHRAMTADTGSPMAGVLSSGVAIAGHTVFVAAADATDGWLVAYRPAR